MVAPDSIDSIDSIIQSIPESETKNMNPDPAIDLEAGPVEKTRIDVLIASIMLSVTITAAIIFILSFATFFVFLFITGSNDLPSKGRMIVEINETGAYVGFENCTSDLTSCQIERYLIVDDDYEQFGVYCARLMDRPIAYHVRDTIRVSYNANILAQRKVLYGCVGYEFSTYQGYIFWKIWYWSLDIMIWSIVIMIGGIFMVAVGAWIWVCWMCSKS